MSGKKFRFSLERVLTLRQHETEAASGRLAEVHRAVAAQEAAVRQARERLNEVAAAAPSGDLLAPNRFRLHDAHRQEARRALEHAQRRLAELSAEAERARRAVVEKRREEETLEQLSEAEAQSFRRAREADETAFLDEQALTSFHRQRRANTR